MRVEVDWGVPKSDFLSIRSQFRTDPRGDNGFTVDGKPAQGVMRRWYGRAECKA